ncbi:PHD finger protein 12-like [Ostrea edulis]|uniref:PHD finger protein 12-like n=1 Tax=Ostrea edulis TaxID=37623 RepID=UPI0024AED154|nr:PHD finger protein 12-like [Ostrea edulis]
MATVEYDLDTSGGLMEQIQKLVAPPVSDEVLRRQRRKERESRRQGRAVNHDSCDSCKEGGDLLCCDWCPAAFHLQCHDPPLEEDDVPPGEWRCHRCKVTPPKPEPPIKEKDDDACSTKSNSSNASRGKSRPQPPVPAIEEMVEGSITENLTPLQRLARAAQMMNPVQFDLPRDIACTTPLPGSSKRKWWGKDRNPNKKFVHELDNGMVPLPAKLCFYCSKSCRVGALVQCDYCPLLYHMDCLNPPLTSLPTNRWMCPNHPENAIDEHLLKGVSLTERIKLWDKFNSRINQHTVKLNFMNKIHRESPPFRIKIKHPKRKSLAIPEAIKLHYQYPPPMLPSMPDPSTAAVMETDEKMERIPETTLEDQEEWLSAVVSLQTSIARHLAQRQIQKSSAESGKSEQNVKLEKPTASVQPVIQGSESSEGNLCDSKVTSMEVDKPNGPVSESVSNGPLEGNRVGAISLLHPPGSSSSSQSSVNGEVGESSKGKTDTVLIKSRSKSVDGSPANIVRVNWASVDKQVTSGASTSTTPSGKNIVISAINKANNTVVTKVLGPTQGNKLLANNMAANSGSSSTSILSPRVSGQSAIKVASVQGRTNTGGSAAKVITVSTPTSVKGGSSSNSNITISGGKPSSTASTQNSSNAIVSLNNSLQQCLEGSGDIELSKLDEKLIQILAWQRLQQLLPSKSNSPQTPNKKGVLNGLLNQAGSTEVKARAVLCPLTSKGQPISMCYRTLNIGTGADMDVCLTQFGHCNYISPKHAYIFYDETTKHYELLNYSEHGTTVDNVLYSCDFSDKPSSTPQPTSVVAAVRKIIKNKKVEKPKDIDTKDEKRLTMSGKANEIKKPCNCKASSSSLIGGSGAGWEGTALLHHGSYVKVGCLQFVFSIVDHATNSLGQDRKKEPMSLLKSTLRGSAP